MGECPAGAVRRRLCDSGKVRRRSDPCVRGTDAARAVWPDGQPRQDANGELERAGRDHRYMKLCPSAKSMQRERDKLREMTGPEKCFVPIPELIQRINTHLGGWSNYFSRGYPRAAFRQINRFVQERLIGHLRRRSQRPYRVTGETSWYAHLHRLGLEP